MKAKVLKVEHAGEWNTKDGEVMHKWNVVTDTGDTGTVNTKKNEAPWNVGEEAEYEVVKKEYNGNTYTTLKKVYANNGGGQGGYQKRAWTPDPERENRQERIARQALIVRQSCLAQAMDYVCRTGDKPSLEAVLASAIAFEKHVLRGDILKRMAHAGEQAAPAPVQTVAQAPVPAAATPSTTLDAAAAYAAAKAAPAATAPEPEPMAVSPLGENDLPF